MDLLVVTVVMRCSARLEIESDGMTAVPIGEAVLEAATTAELSGSATAVADDTGREDSINAVESATGLVAGERRGVGKMIGVTATTIAVKRSAVRSRLSIYGTGS